MGGGNRTPSSFETGRTDETFEDRVTNTTPESQEALSRYTDNDADGEPLRRFVEQDESEDGDPSPEDEQASPAVAGDSGPLAGGAPVAGGTSGESSGSFPEYSVNVPPGIVNASGAGQFARTMFAEGAIAYRHLDPDEEGVVRAKNPDEDAPGRFGGWPEFDEENIEFRTGLTEADTAEGVTARWMELASLTGDSADSYRAFITKYDHNPDRVRDEMAARGYERDRVYPPEMWQAHSQMAMYAFTDALGVRVPDHTWDAEQEYVAVAGVEQPGRASTEPVTELSEEAAARVDEDEFCDIMAVQILAGNYDLHSENVRVGEDGQVHCIDYDRGGSSWSNMAMMESKCRKAASTADRIDRRRGDDFQVSQTDIADRAQEIAVGLEVADETERVVRTVEQYDQVFQSETDRSFADTIRSNIQFAADAARK